MKGGFVYYCLPIFPILTRGMLFLRYPKQMKEVLREQEIDREAHRTFMLALAGFSFSGLLAIVVLDAALRQDFHFAVYYLLLSFLCYLSAINLQSYKAKRWQDQADAALREAATLCLILSVLSILNSREFAAGFALVMTTLAILVWLIDHFLRLRFLWIFLKGRQEK